MQRKIDLLSRLLLDLEADIGTSDTAILVLKSLKDSLMNVRVKTNNDLHAQFQEMVHIVCETTPKFGILNFYFLEILHFLENSARKEKDIKKCLFRKIEDILKEIKEKKADLLKYTETLNVTGKTILIHDHSHTVHEVLQHLKSLGKNFHIIVAEQEHEKTQQNIEVLHKAGIPFRVIPAYMLSHVHTSIDMVFFGALTLKDTMDFVMDPGTHGVISEFHTTKTPIYSFLKTSKFSLWRSGDRSDVLSLCHTRTHCSKPIEYERMKYSHDRVPADLFSFIVTDEGIFTPKELKALFQKKMNAAR